MAYLYNTDSYSNLQDILGIQSSTQRSNITLYGYQEI